MTKESGFTLVEILVAMALMALIATILIGSLQISGHTWQRVSRSVTNTDEIAQAQAFLRETLSTAIPRQPSTDWNSAPSLKSDGSSVAFFGLSVQSGIQGVRQYQIEVDRPSSTLHVRSRLAMDRHAEREAQWMPEVLIRNVDSLTIRFWTQETGSAGRWVERWEEASKLPILVHIEVSFPAHDSRRWPPFYVEPRIDTPVDCVFDVVSRRCRAAT